MGFKKGLATIAILAGITTGTTSCIDFSQIIPQNHRRDYLQGQSYQQFKDERNYYHNQEGKGRWAGRYRSGKRIHRIPTSRDNGYRDMMNKLFKK